jgi:hypothetical protein
MTAAPGLPDLIPYNPWRAKVFGAKVFEAKVFDLAKEPDGRRDFAS